MPQDLRKQNNKLKVNIEAKTTTLIKKRKTSSAYNKWKSYEKTMLHSRNACHIHTGSLFTRRQHLEEAINVLLRSGNQLISLFNLWKAKKKTHPEKLINNERMLTWKKNKNCKPVKSDYDSPKGYRTIEEKAGFLIWNKICFPGA